MTSLTRGPLPARVYWRRRLLVLGIGLALVLLATNIFGGDDGGDDSGGAVASQVAGEPTASAPETGETSAPAKPKKPKKARTPQQPVLAQPDGACADSDIAITPSVENAVAGRNVTITLELRTATAEACTWRVSAKHVTMKITSGIDEIWSSRQCPKPVPVQDVVVRRAVTTFVDVVWNARRSDDGCPVLTDWARSGTYHVKAAALGGEPAEARFELRRPSPEVLAPPTPPKQNKQGEQNKPANPGGAGNQEDPPKTR